MRGEDLWRVEEGCQVRFRGKGATLYHVDECLAVRLPVAGALYLSACVQLPCVSAVYFFIGLFLILSLLLSVGELAG